MGKSNKKSLRGRGGLQGNGLGFCGAGTTWRNIIRAGKKMDKEGVNFTDSFGKNIGMERRRASGTIFGLVIGDSKQTSSKCIAWKMIKELWCQKEKNG